MGLNLAIAKLRNLTLATENLLTFHLKPFERDLISLKPPETLNMC